MANVAHLVAALNAIQLAQQPRVPPELADYIIDFLHDDKAALRQCSLVCRAWLPTSSLHLFERFLWPPCPHAYGVGGRYTILCKCAFLDHSNFWDELIYFIVDSPRLQEYVRTLHIWFQWTVVDQHGWGTGRTEYHHKVSLSEIAAVIDNLPRFRCLHLLSPHFLHDTPSAAPIVRGTRTLERLTLDYPAPPLASDDRLTLLANFFRLFSRITLLQLTDVMRHRAEFHPKPLLDPSDMPEIHTFRVDTASSLAFVQFLRIVTATANPEYLSSIIVNNLIGSISLPDSAPLLQALPNLHSLSLDGLHSAEILQRDLAGAFPRLHTLTVAGLIMMESTTTSTWASLRNVAACPIPSVQELVLRFALEGRRLDPPMAVLDGDIRYALRALDWTLLDGVLSVYKDVALEFELDRPSLAISQAQMADTLRLVESVARDRMSARARQSVHLRVYWKVPSTDPHDT